MGKMFDEFKFDVENWMDEHLMNIIVGMLIVGMLFSVICTVFIIGAAITNNMDAVAWWMFVPYISPIFIVVIFSKDYYDSLKRRAYGDNN